MKKWLQFHLSTLIAVQIYAATVVLLNCRRSFEWAGFGSGVTRWGWPWRFFSLDCRYNFLDGTIRYSTEIDAARLALNLAVLFSIVVLVAFYCEATIRKYRSVTALSDS